MIMVIVEVNAFQFLQDGVLGWIIITMVVGVSTVGRYRPRLRGDRLLPEIHSRCFGCPLVTSLNVAARSLAWLLLAMVASNIISLSVSIVRSGCPIGTIIM